MDVCPFGRGIKTCHLRAFVSWLRFVLKWIRALVAKKKAQFCVRCGAPHSSSDCPKPRELPAKCALCAGEHPANYMGYTVYRELQRRKKPSSKSNFLYDNFLHDNVNTNSDDNTDNVKASHSLPPTYSKVKNNNQIPKSFAQATRNQPNHDHANTSPPSDNNSVLTNFINEFKTLINPLIALPTQVISSLLENKK